MLKIKQAIYRRWRADKQILVIALGEAVRLSLYRQSELQWEASFPYENDAALEVCVRDCLLEHDVEENAAALLLLDAGRLQSEQLTLPTLTAKQLRKTLAWEAEQLFTECSYCYKTMAATAASEGAELTYGVQQDAEQQLVQLYALPYAQQKLYGDLCCRLLMKLEAICVLEQESAQKSEQGQSALLEQEVMQADTEMAVKQGDARVARAVQQWFAGAELLAFPPLPTAVDWQHYRDTARTLLPRIACASLLLAVLVFGYAFAAHYLAQGELQSLQQDAERYAVWHERRAESVQLEQRLAALKQQAQQRKAVTGVSKELEAWGGLRLQGAYLTRLEFKTSQEKQNAEALVKAQEKQQDADIKGKKKESKKQNAVVTVRGVARDEQALDGLLESLQRSSRYSSVQLVQVQRQADATEFSVQTSVTGGK
ncbi:PilN domain-containing protein [Phascolarctobacterium succinatutens]|uniref:PilN domain-containing protein n=1 Tax=Phascolarctobacterium succinatutens TaxID=626940 RepID=UPI0026ED80CD|nr:PilN domain-containing protein [Phascolarctobacterium succinatutens]